MSATRISVIVPVRDGARHLEASLPALAAALPPSSELLVCDDGSSDASAAVAERHGARVLRRAPPAGPAVARNHGAAEARGDVLVFLDADVRVHPDTLARLLAAFDDPAVAAAFGSYDDQPASRNWVSLYKNLAHHFVHNRSRPEASTFWAGCGAIRHDVFDAQGGFDTAYRRPSIEDVELGYRLRERGLPVRLVPEATVTHLKAWTLGGFLESDLRDRAIPWARLVRAGRGLPRDLNFTWADRAASLCVGTAGALLLASLRAPALLAPAAGLLLLALLADAPFLIFARRRVSPAFAAAAAGLHLLHRAAGVLGLILGLLTPGPTHHARPAVGALKTSGGRT